MRSSTHADLRLGVALLGALSILCGSAGRADAADFPCSEEGLDQAIAAAAGGDPGPHSLSCTPDDVIQIHGGRTLNRNLVLDLGDVTLQCIEDSPGSCTFMLVFASSGSCIPGIPPPPCGYSSITLSHAHLQGRVGVGSSSGTLRNITIALPDDPQDDSPAITVGSYRPGYGGPPSLLLYDSTVTSNGDAISGGWAVVVEGSTLAARLPTAVGLRIAYGGNGRLTNSTVEEIANRGNVTLINSTITTRSPDRLAYDAHCEAALTSTNSILDGSCVVSPPNCGAGYEGTSESGGGNVEVGGATCGFVDETDQSDVTPEELALGPLADNGGPTLTRALGADSVAVDAAVLDACPPTDQRGAPRPEPGGNGCDSGAFELPEPTASLLGAVALGLLAALRRPRRRLPGRARGLAALCTLWLLGAATNARAQTHLVYADQPVHPACVQALAMHQGDAIPVTTAVSIEGCMASDRSKSPARQQDEFYTFEDDAVLGGGSFGYRELTQLDNGIIGLVIRRVLPDGSERVSLAAVVIAVRPMIRNGRIAKLQQIELLGELWIPEMQAMSFRSVGNVVHFRAGSGPNKVERQVDFTRLGKMRK